MRKYSTLILMLVALMFTYYHLNQASEVNGKLNNEVLKNQPTTVAVKKTSIKQYKKSKTKNLNKSHGDLESDLNSQMVAIDDQLQELGFPDAIINESVTPQQGRSIKKLLKLKEKIRRKTIIAKIKKIKRRRK